MDLKTSNILIIGVVAAIAIVAVVAIVASSGDDDPAESGDGRWDYYAEIDRSFDYDVYTPKAGTVPLIVHYAVANDSYDEISMLAYEPSAIYNGQVYTVTTYLSRLIPGHTEVTITPGGYAESVAVIEIPEGATLDAITFKISDLAADFWGTPGQAKLVRDDSLL